MEDDDLAQIRKARLEQLKTQGGAGSSGARNGSSGAGEDQRQYDSLVFLKSTLNSHYAQLTNLFLFRQQEEARQSILNQILEPEAADRLGRIRLVKESRAQDVENRLIMLARTGQLRSKVTEEQLKDLLGAVSEKEHKEEEKIVVSRRKGGWDDEDDDLLDL